MQPVEGMPQFPTKCPLPNCKAKLHRDWILGVAPKFVGLVNVLIRCKGCKRVYGFTMPTGAVHPFLETLPEDDSLSFKLKLRIDTPISDEEICQVKDAFGPDRVHEMISAFAEIEEYDTLGVYDDDDMEDIDDLEE